MALSSANYPVLKTVLPSNFIKIGISPTIYEERLNYYGIKNELKALNSNMAMSIQFQALLNLTL